MIWFISLVLSLCFIYVGVYMVGNSWLNGSDDSEEERLQVFSIGATLLTLGISILTKI